MNLEDRDGLARVAGCDNADRACDLVFVHGIDGGSHSTWMAEMGRDFFWPFWVGEDHPLIGVWTLGYGAAVSKWKAESLPLADSGLAVLEELSNNGLGKRPIIFITHSMGGILVKQMLQFAEGQGVDRWAAIQRRTVGIAFIATPHAGASIAGFAKYVRLVLRTNEQVGELTAHNSRLRNLHGWFLNLCSKQRLSIRSYCETRDTNGIRVVDRTSAEPNVLGERAIPLQEDHVSICKPRSREQSKLYVSIKAFLSDCLDSLQEEAPGESGEADGDALYRRCLLGEDVFFDRTDLRKKLGRINEFEVRRILVVQGESKSGRSYSDKLIRFEARERKFETISVGLRYLPAEKGLEALARRIASAVPQPGEPPEQGTESVARWMYHPLMEWTIGKMRQANGTWWLIFDEFDHEVVKKEVYDFIVDLALQVEDDLPSWRLAMLGFDRPIPPQWDQRHRHERIVALERGHLKEFFDRLYREKGQPPHEPTIQKLADQYFEKFQAQRARFEASRANADADDVLDPLRFLNRQLVLCAKVELPGEEQLMAPVEIEAEGAVPEDPLSRQLLDLASSTASETASAVAVDPSAEAYRAAAAVVSVFDPAEIRPHAHPEDDAGKAALLDDSAQIIGQELVWTLRPEARARTLRRLVAEKRLREVVQDAPTEKDALSRLLAAAVEGAPIRLEKLSEAELTAALELAKAVGSDLPALPPAAAIRFRLRRERLLAPLRHVADRHFCGREDELEKLRNYVGVANPRSVTGSLFRAVREVFDLKKRPPLMIFGPGGMGKSTLISRFILEHAELEEEKVFPWAYVDFDRPGMTPREPLTILAEILAQLGTQYEAIETRCEEVRQDLGRYVSWVFRDRIGAARVESVGSAAARSSSELERGRFVEALGSLFGEVAASNQPLLLVLDTFEEIQHYSRPDIPELFGFLVQIQRAIPRLRVVLAGRTRETGQRITPLPLGPLKDEDGKRFLEAQEVPPEAAERIVAKLKANPLTLRLAMNVYRRDGLSEDDLEEFFSKVDEERIQGELYRRFLHHIQDKQVQAIAHPGLVLRRLTPELLLEVLAEPCGLLIRSLEEARELFGRLAGQDTLVSWDGDAIVHRSDVRRVMVELLQNAPMARAIHANAVRYYQRTESLESRTEEIYHRYCLEQDEKTIDSRWLDGIEDGLRSAIDEVPESARSRLIARVGGGLTERQLRQAPLAQWERFVARRARQLSDHARYEEALKLIRGRPERTPASPLLGLEVAVLVRVGELGQARSRAESALAEARRLGDQGLEREMLGSLGSIARREGRFDEATSRLERAARLAEELGEPLEAMDLLLLALQSSQQAEETDERDVRRRLAILARGAEPSQISEASALFSAIADILEDSDPEIGESVRQILDQRSDPSGTDSESESSRYSGVGSQLYNVMGRLFRSTDELEAFLRSTLGMTLRELSRGGSVESSVFEVVSAFERRGTMGPLVRALERFAPGDAEVERLAEELQRMSVASGPFSESEWCAVRELLAAEPAAFGLPERVEGSLVMASFNIRKLGDIDTGRKHDRDAEVMSFLADVCQRFDLLAVQEVMSSTAGIRRLAELMGPDYGLVLSDTRGSGPGGVGVPERMAFLYNRAVVRRTEFVADVDFDRSEVLQTLVEEFPTLSKEIPAYRQAMADDEKARAAGRKAKKPGLRMPSFLGFLRPPLAVSFASVADGAEPLQLLGVNCHLVFGDSPELRRRESAALLRWLAGKVRESGSTPFTAAFFGQINADVDRPASALAGMQAKLAESSGGSRRKTMLSLPFAFPHPRADGVFRTNVQLSQSYDQIGLVTTDKRLGRLETGRKGHASPDLWAARREGPDYGVFNFSELFSRALLGRRLDELDSKQRRAFVRRFEFRVSDHLPLWYRLPLPPET